MSNLIVSLAIGDPCWHQANLMVQTMRGAGRFTGDIVVYADRRADINGAKVVVNEDAKALFSHRVAKAFIGKSMDVSRYDKVLFLDSDIVAIAPVDSLFLHDGIRLQLDGEGMGVGRQDWMFNLHNDPDINGPCYNSGTILCPANQWNMLCQLWWNKIVEVYGSGPWPLHHFDQPVLGHLVRTGELQVRPFPDNTVNLFLGWQSVTSDTVLVHTTTNEKYRIMRTISELAALDRINLVRLPMMLPSEVAFIQKHLSPSLTMLEWGSGNSTHFWSRFVGQLCTIEHDKEWWNRIPHDKCLAVYSPVTGHPVLGDGDEYQPGYDDLFKDYINAASVFGRKFDIIIVDGRARLACARAGLKLLNPGGLMFIHDFTNRERYHPILSECRVVGQCESLIVLKPAEILA